jgi:hypothetical protein
MTSRLCTTAGLAIALLAAGSGAALADKVKNPTAVFSGLDKITGRTVSFEVAVDETIQFGALQLTPKVCYTRPQTESPNTTSFVEVDEVTLDNKFRRIFTGWVFASSPGLHAIEHAIYDIWLVDCKGGSELIAEPKDHDDAPAVASREQRPRRREADRPAGEAPARTAQQAAPRPQGQRLDVAPPRGTPVQPPREPSRRYFPSNEGPFQRLFQQFGPDPAGGNR